jgi:hypothetical protein
MLLCTCDNKKCFVVLMSGILNGVSSCYPEYTLGLTGYGPRSMNNSDFLFRTGYGPFVSPLIPWTWL